MTNAGKDLMQELLEWSYDACLQGTGNQMGEPGWHMYMSTWEQADELLPRVAEYLRENR